MQWTKGSHSTWHVRLSHEIDKHVLVRGFFSLSSRQYFPGEKKTERKKKQTNVNVTHTEYWFLCFFAFPFFVERRIRTPCFTDSKSRLCFTWKVSALPNWKYTKQRRAGEVKKRRRRRSFFSFLLYSVLCKTRKMSCLRAEWNNS